MKQRGGGILLPPQVNIPVIIIIIIITIIFVIILILILVSIAIIFSTFQRDRGSATKSKEGMLFIMESDKFTFIQPSVMIYGISMIN